MGSKNNAGVVASGIGSLDEKLGGGLRLGSPNVIADKPGMGKTALMLQIATGQTQDHTGNYINRLPKNGGGFCVPVIRFGMNHY